MNYRVRRIKYLPFLILAIFLLIPILAVGMPFRIDRLPDKGKNFSCGTCHVNPGGGGVRNPFGRDWEAIAIPAGDIYVPELAKKDSDGDGFTNDEEFEAGTHPGDASSKPNKPKAVRARGKLLTRWGKIKADALRP